MFYYSDLILEKKKSDSFSIFINKNSYNDLPYKIYDEDKNLILEDKILNNKISFKIDKHKKVLNNYLIEINKNNKIYKIPVTICILEKDEKYIICDIDFTLSATNFFLYLSNNVLHIKALYNSQYFLNELSKFFRIIYLTGRKESFTRITKIWLEMNNFPPGPLLARNIDYKNNLCMFKTEVLKNITTISKNGVGIGDLKSDIFAYLNNNILPIKIQHPLFYYSKNDKYKYKDNHYIVYSWKGIERLFIDKKLFGFNVS